MFIIRDLLNNYTKLTVNKTKVLKNVFWAVFGKIINILSGIFVGIFVARYLGPENFGLMNYVISYVSLFSILANFGLDNIEIRELAKNKTNKNSILGTAFIIRLIFSLFTLLLIIITLSIFESDRFTFLMVIIYSLSLILSTFNVIRNYFTAIVLNEFIVKSEILQITIGSIIKILFLYYHFSLAWFISASVFDFILIAIGYLFSYKMKVGNITNWKFNKKLAKYFIFQSFPLLLSGTAIIIYQKIDQIMIRNMIDNVAVGQFAVSSKITELAIFIPMVIAQTITPFLVQAYEQNKKLYYIKRQQFMDSMIWSSIAIALCISVLSHPIIKVLFGVKYLEAIPVLQIMAWKAVFVALFASSGQLIIIENLQKYAIIRNLFGCVISVVLNLIFIPLYGIIGSAISTVVTTAFSGYFSHRFIGAFKHIFKIQSNSFFFGFSRITHLFK